MPLQNLTMFQIKSSTPLQTIIFFVGFFAIVGIIVFLNISKMVKNSAAFQGKPVNIHFKNYTISAEFWKLVRHFDLSKAEVARLERILSRGGLNACEVLHNAELLDEQFKNEILDRERKAKPNTVDKEIADIYAVRNIIDFFLASAKSKTTESQGKSIVVRNYRRKQSNFPCTFCLVDMVTDKGEKKLVPKNEKLIGTQVDLSIGGCSIKTSMKIKAGKLLKINFNIKRQEVTVLGQSLRINFLNKYSIIHVKFLKLTTRSKNLINTYIFDYE
jgi:hypothetical protein